MVLGRKINGIYHAHQNLETKAMQNMSMMHFLYQLSINILVHFVLPVSYQEVCVGWDFV